MSKFAQFVVWLLLLIPVNMKAQTESKPSPVALKTNLLYDVLLVPNIGIEVSLGRQWTVAGEGMLAWWSSDNKHRYWQTYGGYLTVRRYLGTNQTPFTGHHVGAYGLALTYDVEWGGKGYQASKFGFGGGLEYGYSMAVGRRLNLDFSLGIGYQGGEYKEYEPQGDRYMWLATRQRHWFGPTKAEVSLVWLLGGSGRSKKGGDK
jgi:hypothetical protein